MSDGQIPTPERQADVLAIQDLAVAYGYAVDDRDWARWESLFMPDARVDYTESGGIAGTPSELAAWLPGAMAMFAWGLHSISNHEIRFVGDDEATGRVHIFNRNGVVTDDAHEFVDVGGLYLDTYVRSGDAWKFSERVEHTLYVAGDGVAAAIRDVAASTASDGRRPHG